MKNIESREGLSDYTRQLTTEIKELMNKIFPVKKEIESNPLEKSAEELNRILARHCLTFVLSEMSPEQRQDFKKQDLNLLKVIELALEKTQLLEEERGLLEEKLKEITPEDFELPSKIVLKLDLLNDESPVSKFENRLYELIKQKPEVIETYTYLTWEAGSEI